MTATTKMKSINFTSLMGNALHQGRKTQTRRVINPQPVFDGRFWNLFGAGWSDGINSLPCVPGHSLSTRNPYGQPGDRLWVREPCWMWGDWRKDGKTPTGLDKYWFEPIGKKVVFEKPAALGIKGQGNGWFWRNPRFMPRWASRHTIEITGIRVERLQEITDADAINEGFPLPEGMPAKITTREIDGKVRREMGTVHDFKAVDGFRRLWEAINGKRGYAWDANPWLWLIHFKVVS